MGIQENSNQFPLNTRPFGCDDSMLADYPDVLNLDQLCTILQIGRKNGYKLLRDGDIKFRKVGRKYIIPKRNVVAYIHDDLQP